MTDPLIVTQPDRALLGGLRPLRVEELVQQPEQRLSRQPNFRIRSRA